MHVTHETETIYKFSMRFDINTLVLASDRTEVPVLVDEGAGFRETKCAAGHIRSCMNCYGFREIPKQS